MTCQRGRGGAVTGQSCCSHRKAFPAGFPLPVWFPAASELVLFPSPVPGGIASESLTFTPLEDMIFLKWEEPLEPNGLITQYEVDPDSWGTHGTRGDRRGFQQGELGQLLLRLMGVKGGCSVAAAPEPLAWGRIQPVLNRLPERPSQLGSPAFRVTGVTQQGLF